MSKISKYLAEQRAICEQPRTVSDFAFGLGMKPSKLLSQLAKAGLKHTSAQDLVTAKDSQALLEYLKIANRSIPHRRVVISDPLDTLAEQVANEHPGADLEALQEFARGVLFGWSIPDRLQAIVNVLIAQVVVTGGLPAAKKRGRPSADEARSLRIAETYWRMRDAGVSYGEAIAAVASEFHKSERHLMRIIEGQTQRIGTSPEERARRFAYLDAVRKLHEERGGSIYEYFVADTTFSFTKADHLERISELKRELHGSTRQLTKKESE